MKYTSENFQLHHISSYRLFVKTDFLKDTLLVVDDKKVIQALHSYDSDSPSNDVIKLLALPFSEVYINIPLQSLVLLPQEVFDAADEDLYHDFLQDEHKERTLTYVLSQQGVVACYQYDLMLYNKWMAIFPEAQCITDFPVLLHGAYHNLRMDEELIGLNIRDMHVDFYVYQQGQLQLYISFEIETKDDLVYFILNTIQTLGLSSTVSRILVSGITDVHEYASVLQRFSNSVTYITSKAVLASDREEVIKEASLLHTLLDSELCV